jgi:predicted transcriptional regulator
MSISITLTPDEERKLAELARACGKDPAAHAHDIVTAYLNGANQSDTMSFEEILAPIWEGWRTSGLTDGEVDDLFEHARQDARSERRRPKETP